jgi:hypothetical protein
MWIALIAGWVVGSAVLYVYLVKSAREPRHGECMDCNLLDCAECPLTSEQQAEQPMRRAA